ncbi:PIBF1 [Symbiodinium sp. CCMP2592]|nr:PIBF1 [Symbiodinium sp. CCMP2592]
MLPVAGSAFCYVLLLDSKLVPLREFGVFIDIDVDYLEDVDFTSASAPIDEGDLESPEAEARSSDARSIATSEAELDLGAAGIALLEARLRLSPALGAAVPAVAVPVSQVPLAPASPVPRRLEPELEGSVRALAEQQRLQAAELAELRRRALSQSQEGAGQSQSSDSAARLAEKVLRAEADARGARQDALAHSRRAQVLEEKWALGEREIADLKAKIAADAEDARRREAHLEEKLTLKDARISEMTMKLETAVEAHSKRVAFLEQMLASRDAKIQELSEKLDKDFRLVQQDAEGHARRVTLLEETLALRDEKIAELQSKVDGLREKKRELVRKAELEQVSTTQEVRDQVNAEIRRFQEKAQADIEAVRTGLNALHQKEVHMLQERISAAEERSSGLQSRLDNEEQAHQALQLSASRVRAELQNEITELTGSLKLRVFEIERAALTHEEVSAARQKLDAENEALKKQVETLRKEFYNLELQYKEGRASERAELASLREQMKGYLDLERDLDAAIAGCAEAPLASSADAQEALLIGTTLGSAPASAQRRIQQSLLLAQELQRRSRELRQQTTASEEAQKEISRLKLELETTQLQVRAAGFSEPQVYLQSSLRECQAEVSRAKLELKSCKQDLLQAQQRAEHAQRARLQVEEDMRKLLSSRDFLQQLKQEMDSLKPVAVLAPTDGTCTGVQGGSIAALPESLVYVGHSVNAPDVRAKDDRASSLVTSDMAEDPGTSAAFDPGFGERLVGVLEPAELKPDWSDVAEKVMLAVNRPKPVLAGAGFAVAVALIVAVAVTASQPHPALPEVFPPEHHREAGRPMLQSFAPSSLAEEEAPLTIRMCEPGRLHLKCVLHWCDLENTPSNNLTSWPASQAATCRCYSQSQTTASCTNISLSLVVSGPRPASLTQDVLHAQALSFVAAEYADANSVEITAATSRRLQSVVLEDWPSGTTQVDPLTQLPPINLGFATARRSSSSCEDAIYCYCSPKSCTTPSGYRRTVNDLTLPAPADSTLQPQGRPSLEVIVLFGISQREDRSTLSGTFTAAFDAGFDPASPWSQRAMLRVCNELPSELNILSSNCWIQDFRNWLIGRGQKFPVDRFLDFHLTLKEFLVGHPSAASAMWLNEANNLTATMFTFQVVPTDGADATLEMRDRWLNYAMHSEPTERARMSASSSLLHLVVPFEITGLNSEATSTAAGAWAQSSVCELARMALGPGKLYCLVIATVPVR